MTLTSQSYHKDDQREVIVLVNGLGRSSHEWYGLDRKLANRYRVLVWDARGFGRSRRACQWGLRVEDLANDLSADLDAWQIHKAHIFGVSLGGMIAMALAISHPERCLSLTLVNSSIGRTGKHPFRLTGAAMRFLMWSPLLQRKHQAATRRLVDLVVGKDCSAEQRLSLAQHMGQLMQERQPDLSHVLKQVLAAMRFRPEKNLVNLKIPTLILRGSHDAFVPPVHSLILTTLIPSSTLYTIAHGGHELMLDKVDELVACQTRWIEQLKAASRKEGVRTDVKPCDSSKGTLDVRSIRAQRTLEA